MFESFSFPCFWDTPLHFLKTCFSLESGFLLLLRAPEIPTIKFSGMLNIMVVVWRLQHSPLLRYTPAFSQNKFLLWKWLSFIPRAPEFPTSKFSGVLKRLARVLRALAFAVSQKSYSIFSKHICLQNGFLTFLELQKSLQDKFSGVPNTMAKVSKLHYSPFLRYSTAFCQTMFMLKMWLFCS